MEIFTFGGGRREKRCESLLRGKGGRYSRLFLLPIPTTKDKKCVFGTEVPLSDIAGLCDGESLVVGYALPEDFVGECRRLGASVVDAGEDEAFLRENADITALGALGWILTSFPLLPKDMKIGIIGYGRIGKRLCELILTHSGRVVVYTRSEKTRIALGEVGIESRLFSDKNDFSGIDILLNTAPTRIVGEGDIDTVPKGLVIAELASGVNFPPGLKVTSLSSLPERMYPETAGAVYAEFIERHL